MKRPTIIRILSIVLLATYQVYLLPPPAAICQTLHPQHRLKEFVNNGMPPFSPVMRYLTDERGNCGISLGHAFGHAPEPAGDTESKPWYKKWWVMGIGAAFVTGTVLLIAGGGDDDEPAPDRTLPDFPDPPTPAFR